MNIKRIIKEFLIREVGEATAEPYMWRHVKSTEDYSIYDFVTVGGSRVKITVTFFKIGSKTMIGLVNKDRKLGDDMINLIKNNPEGFWDVEFSVSDVKSGPLDDPYMTISKSEYRSGKQEFFKILSTVNKILNNFMKKKEVRGITFKPVSEKRGLAFMQYFEKNMPDAIKMITYEGVHIIIVDKDVKPITKTNSNILTRKSFKKDGN